MLLLRIIKIVLCEDLEKGNFYQTNIRKNVIKEEHGIKTGKLGVSSP